MTTDLDDPVIIASITIAGEQPAPLLIDGVHSRAVKIASGLRPGRDGLI